MSRKGLKVVLKEEKAFVTRVEINGSVRRETYVVSGMRVTVVQSRHPNVVPPSEPQSSKTRGRSESRKTNARGRSKSEKFNRPPCKYFLKATCAKSPCDWHPPECQFVKRNRDVSSAQSAHFRTGRLKSNQTKSRKRVMTRVQLLL